MPKNFVEEPFSLSLVSGIEKIHASEGYVTILRLKFFVSQCRKSSQRNLFVLCFRNLLVAKKFMGKKGGVSKISVEIFLSESAEKFCRGTL